MRRVILPVLLLAVALTLAAYLASFVVHVAQMLAYPYPLDYGEGPLLAQVEHLRSGTTIWRLYADPAQPPFLVVNYPPVYLLLVTGLSFLTGDALLAGRLVALVATLGCVGALGGRWTMDDGRWRTKDERRKTEDEERRTKDEGRKTENEERRTENEGRGTKDEESILTVILRPALLVALLFLSIPVVREWAGYMRVDALALCLGLWGLMLLRDDGRRATNDEGRAISDVRPSSFVVRPLLAGLLLVLAGYTKPSMLAAPIAGGVWWLLAGSVALRLRLVVLAWWAAFALLPLLLLQWASGGWFWFHIVTANTNRWDGDLAQQFWADQMRLRWPLVLAGVVGFFLILIDRRRSGPMPWWVPWLYTLIGMGTAIGVGKVGAYANYFLELYAGLVWLAGLGVSLSPQRHEDAKDRTFHTPLRFSVSAVILVLLLLSMFYYSPLWSREKLRVAGLLEPNPPQLFFRRSNGLWGEATREVEVLAAQGRVQRAITAEVRAAGGPIFTDTPGVAAQAGVATPLQAFEHRQILDSGHWDQRSLLRALANGSYPLAVIDFLGNWLTYEMVALLTHRYAQDGAFGTFDMYRPIAPGPLVSTEHSLAGLRLVGYRLVAPGDGSSAYSPGELLTLTLEWARPEGYSSAAEDLDVVVQLTDGGENVLLEESLPLLYGALRPDDWIANEPLQHMQPFSLPYEMLPRRYTIAVGLHNGGEEVAAPQPIATIDVSDPSGQLFGTEWFVPEPFLQAWGDLGGIERAGLPLTPAVPFAWGRLQCFELLCLEERGGVVAQRPLGERLFLSETIRGDGVVALREPFRSFWEARGGAASLGPPISGKAFRNAYIVQWTRYARLERHPETGALGLGRLGDDSLRLSPGMRYRWPQRR